MMFFAGFIAGVIVTFITLLAWWYRGAGLVTGILDDDILMQKPASHWKELED